MGAPTGSVPGVGVACEHRGESPVSTTAKTEPATAPGPPEPRPESERCLACGAVLAEDQEWCLECGAARTVIHAPPDWRVGVAIMLAVILVVLIVLVVVLP